MESVFPNENFAFSQSTATTEFSEFSISTSLDWLDDYLEDEPTDSSGKLGTLFYTETERNTNSVNTSLPKFSFFKAPISATAPTKAVDHKEVYSLIKGTAYKDVTEQLRKITDKDGQRTFKQMSLDSVCFSGIFPKRGAKNLTVHSYLIAIDIDDVKDVAGLKKSLIQDPFSLMIFTSPKGAGLKWLLKIDISSHSHEQHFRAITKYCQDKYGETPDSKARDIARACFLCHDPEIFLSPVDFNSIPYFDIEKYLVTDDKEKTSKEAPVFEGIKILDRATRDNICYCISEIQRKGMDLTADYSNWLSCGFALATFGEAGRIYFHELSRSYEKYTYTECNDKFNECLTKQDGRTSIGTFFHYCIENGISSKSAPTENIAQLLTLATIDPAEVLQAPPVCLEIVTNGQGSTIGTLGNFSMAIGKAKSRKTFFITVALAAAVKNDYVLNRIKGTLPDTQNVVLHFDTEQSRYHVQKALNRVVRLSGIEAPANLITYGLRKFSPAERLQMIEHSIYNTENLGFVVIDGVRDLVSSINDEDQATMLSSKLLKWTEEKNIHIITVLHQNKSDLNARGHLGTELLNKAESVLSITKDQNNKDVSIVQAEFCREREFDPFAFEINDFGLPVLVDLPEKEYSSVNRTKNPGDYNLLFHGSILNEIFTGKTEYRYEELWRKIKLVFAGHEIIMGDNKSKDFVAYYLDMGKIEKSEKRIYTQHVV